MERLLILSTATAKGAVGVAAGGEVIAEKRIDLSHAANSILPAIDAVLKSSRIPIGSVDRIVVVKGPGTFTGSRVGVSAGKALSYGLRKPLTGVTTFQAVAFTGFLDAGASPGSWWAMLDARHHQYAVQRFSATDGSLVPAGDPRVGGLSTLGLLDAPGGHVACAYSRDAVLPEGTRSAGGGGGAVWHFDVFPSCRGVVAAASRMGTEEDPFSLEPLYLRTTDELFRLPGAGS